MIPDALRYFRAAASAGSVRRAAERLSIAPSAVSRQIARLESDLGVALLDRRSRALSLTEAGRMVLAYTERADEHYGALRSSLRSLSDGESGRVRVATVEGVVSYFLSKHLSRFESQHPGVRVDVSVIGSRSVLDTLREAGADIALAFGASARPDLVQHARLDQPLCVIMAAGHPLARKKSLRFAELAGMRAALPDSSFEIRAMVDRMAKRSRVKLVQVVETNSLEMAKGFARNSQLITFLPRYAALRDIASRELCAVPLRDRPFSDTRITLLTPRSHSLSSAARALLEALKAAMASYGRAA